MECVTNLEQAKINLTQLEQKYQPKERLEEQMKIVKSMIIVCLAFVFILISNQTLVLKCLFCQSKEITLI